ncbi:TIGR00282 family metallophosphoesterase [Mycoplasmopsis agassizii]|uniref:TIGR00282 family metallophosphoesterase n=1 Tax=Mycoplasmopsis agassizii TaxID=33922 RepID=A0ABX4H6P5_9BACT|nr:TIGR00282 family metallophosphoesterase [Mycoplasmopsis agassizii]PAF55541.1 TIGR00282 family metallophosphoesterase [Mycoplasmopsis agassizii]SMC17919.1 hypothetical protein SAMN02745179_00549 [Mycoplasmopsis agassizii]
MNEAIKILFLGDIFGAPGIKILEEHLKMLREKYQVDLVIAQAENVSGRKGLIKKDYLKLKQIGVDIFTLGNHVWSKREIKSIIDNEDVIRPLNIKEHYQGQGVRTFTVKNKKLEVYSLMGIAFNKLMPPWTEEAAENFFDVMDKALSTSDADYRFIDFHAETTSEKNVLAWYLDGKVNALVGTHTHVQTNDARILPKGSAYITDVGMVGPINSAIGANYQEVYEKMRFNKKVRFQVSESESQINGIVIELGQVNKIIEIINLKPSATTNEVN